MSYINGIYNTLSSYIKTTNNNLNNAQSYNYLASTSISSNLYFTYASKDLLQLRLNDYVTNTSLTSTLTNYITKINDYVTNTSLTNTSFDTKLTDYYTKTSIDNT